MVPISRGKQLAGLVGAMAVGYALSWIATPGPGTGPVDTFGPTFGAADAPVIVAPAPSPDDRSIDASEPQHSSRKPLQPRRDEPI